MHICMHLMVLNHKQSRFFVSALTRAGLPPWTEWSPTLRYLHPALSIKTQKFLSCTYSSHHPTFLA